MFFLLNKKEPKNQGKFKSPAMVVYRTYPRYPCHDHPIHHRTKSRRTKFSFAVARFHNNKNELAIHKRELTENILENFILIHYRT